VLIFLKIECAVLMTGKMRVGGADVGDRGYIFIKSHLTHHFCLIAKKMI